MGSCKGPPGRETTCSDNINSTNNNTGPHTHNNNNIHSITADKTTTTFISI